MNWINGCRVLTNTKITENDYKSRRESPHPSGKASPDLLHKIFKYIQILSNIVQNTCKELTNSDGTKIKTCKRNYRIQMQHKKGELQIRRIEEKDRKKNFETGNLHFDCDSNGNKLDLGFYLDRDNSKNYETYVLVADDDSIIGLLSIQKREDRLHLSRVGVQKNLLGHSYGSYLIKYAIERAIE